MSLGTGREKVKLGSGRLLSSADHEALRKSRTRQFRKVEASTCHLQTKDAKYLIFWQ
jgi:SET domain-containing protein